MLYEGDLGEFDPLEQNQNVVMACEIAELEAQAKDVAPEIDLVTTDTLKSESQRLT